MKLGITGGRPLQGEVVVEGSKNSALPIFAATLLTDDDVLLQGIPTLKDVQTIIAILEHVGKRVENLVDGSYRIRSSGQLSHVPPPLLIRRMRASFLVLGPLLARLGEVAVSLPGGDAIGLRPVDLHLKGLQAMGAELEQRDGIVFARAKSLQPAEIHLSYPSVGATEHLMMTAALVPGRTVIRNPAQEPEIHDLADFLRGLGTGIELHSTFMEIDGCPELQGTTHTVIPDRLCAGTYTIATALACGEVFVRCIPWHLRPLVNTLREMGVQIEEQPDGLVVTHHGAGVYRPVDIETRPYPGFPTDMHPPMMPLLALTAGESRLRETLYEDRFSYVKELCRMGADIRLWGQTAIVRGVKELAGAEVQAKDIRAGATLVLAGLSARGTTVVHDEEEHIPRGYSDLAGTLRQLGAEIEER
ncbi:MAG: UDP-N-acetylglucosamine 1-carboxyvinyltransferase [Candidatus Fraserbacteria bacterium RBG_16_55_9]|uniref:UDP-N-acetylglucosamine 1-carboxyvinyltransferase n=1 Tax=Fraserbacteria sp. (strain RBG_16_55_9) TaxID=1817864 RepID=A0A1F5URE0_FRAXR|nr:MAG: UDP-N-acetylglucosamine 1-carboxyvinyltransferase [Candidatus Fraserbacteria bacterium RBG_16_55_9]